MNKLLLLEDNAERVLQFRDAMEDFGDNWEIVHWWDAHSMLKDCVRSSDDVRLISLDHDLNPLPGVVTDPGTGRQISKLLAGHLPLAPMIIHSTNADAAWSMHNDLRFGGWSVERVGPIGENWVRKLWLPKAREMLSHSKPHALFHVEQGHEECCRRAQQSLEGLAIGDALGEMLAYRHYNAAQIIAQGLPSGPWFHTDDTEMAISIVEVLQLYGYIHQDALSRRFAYRFELDPDRGYGKMTRMQMNEIIRGGDWRKAAAGAFSGNGSMGNGGAMRVAPLGAFFADDFKKVVREAEASASVTHTHSEGVAGTIAIAVAAAVAAQVRDQSAAEAQRWMFTEILAFTPNSKVRNGLLIAEDVPETMAVEEVAKLLGNGSQVTAPDTVPFAIWCAAHHLHDYVNGVITSIRAGSDCDTNAAIVGGIIAAGQGHTGIPADWLENKEPIRL